MDDSAAGRPVPEPDEVCPHGRLREDRPRHLWCHDCAEEWAFSGAAVIQYAEYRARMMAAARRREGRPGPPRRAVTSGGTTP